MDLGFPAVGLWADIGGEFRNYKMEQFMNKLGFKMNFDLAYLPLLNGVNKSNHYSCDVIVGKIIDGDKKVDLQEVVNMASWTHNSNVNILGYTPLQLVTGKKRCFSWVVDWG